MADERMSRTERRNHVLDTARDLVLAQGFHAVTLDTVAREAGISRPLLYKLFGGLPGLLTSLIDRETDAALDGLNRAMAGVDSATGTASELVPAAVSAMVNATASAPLSWQILLTPPQGGPIELYDRIALGRAAARGAVRDALEVAHPQVDDFELTARLVHLVLEDLVRLHVNAPAEYPRERIVRQADSMVGALLAGEIRTEGAR